MKYTFLFIVLTISTLSKGQSLIRFYENDSNDFFGKVGYKNAQGDTIVPLGKYRLCYTSESNYFAVVSTHDSRLIAIDTNDRELFEVYWFDNMPDNEFMQDYGEVELFRIKINGLIGFANFKGEIVIQPQFQCADYFRDGKCWVAKTCKLVKEGGYHRMVSSNGYYIDTKGNVVN